MHENCNCIVNTRVLLTHEYCAGIAKTWHVEVFLRCFMSMARELLRDCMPIARALQIWYMNNCKSVNKSLWSCESVIKELKD